MNLAIIDRDGNWCEMRVAYCLLCDHIIQIGLDEDFYMIAQDEMTYFYHPDCVNHREDGE